LAAPQLDFDNIVAEERGQVPGPPRVPDVFEDVVIGDLIPMIDSTYRTIPDREHRAMTGTSRGASQ